MDEDMNEDMEAPDVSSVFAGGTELRYRGRISSHTVDKRSLLMESKTGEMVQVLKSTICWRLNSSPGKLSSDRLVRVQQNDSAEKRARQSELRDPKICEDIHLGDWCLF